MTPQWIFRLGAPLLDHSPQDLGGKGWQLAELAAMKYPVPGGFVLTTGATGLFTGDDAALALPNSDGNGDLSIDQLSTREKALRNHANTFRLPEDLGLLLREEIVRQNADRFAVRSSAVGEDGAGQSFAGMFDTHLNVKPEAINEAIIDCWASQFTARATSYTAQDATRVSRPVAFLPFAIVVQQMVRAEVSGVCFTSDPNGLYEKCLIINAAWGLGQSVVDGSVTPDCFIIDRRGNPPRRIPGKQLRMRTEAPTGGVRWVEVAGSKIDRPKLDAQQIQQLVSLAYDLERTMGFTHGCDIEWAISNGKLHLLQCRPITKRPYAETVHSASGQRDPEIG